MALAKLVKIVRGPKFDAFVRRLQGVVTGGFIGEIVDLKRLTGC